MNLSKLFELQRQLDEHIEKEHPRKPGEDRLAKKILALQVELGELANNWRGFKYWSYNQKPKTEELGECPLCKGTGDLGTVWAENCIECGGTGKVVVKNPLLEEYVDCLHFILSIAIELGYTVDDLYVWDDELVGKTEDIFLELMYWVVLIKSKDERKRKEAFRTVCYIFFNMAEQRLGFTWEQIEEAYMRKNAINHERQNNGY
ncbi:dUTP diphosphatase [Parageobacillus thermoglucosidasius]|uniref:dUTP diphosphatase n=1 Tax=Parageobacillus thermoglucosidasius TaxID=1426 RepID=UPI00031D8774|nr:dUTP diphosphatase [Parageobacillus thermoglucosidasius]